MSLKPSPIQPVPIETARVAQAAFPKGNPYLTLRDNLGTIFEDLDFIDLYPRRGQPALSPWRLALVTILQFRENLPDRQTADAVRSRIDWKYLLGLELTDAGFDFSVLSEFRSRLLQNGAESIILDKLLEQCISKGLLKSGGQQRTDSTRVLAAIRVVNRLELLGETLRAALNQLATEVPDWLSMIAPIEWYKRYGRRIEEQRLPDSKPKKMEWAQQVGKDGFFLLDALDNLDNVPHIQQLSQVQILRQVWQRHYARQEGIIHFLAQKELSTVGEAIQSPYDQDARYNHRSGVKWVGYFVHLTESCDEDTPHLLTNSYTTPAGLHESRCTLTIQQDLVDKELCPKKHVVDSAYVSADLIVKSRKQGISLIGPARTNPNWQHKVDGGYDMYQFEIDWDNKQARCPQGKVSRSWRERKYKVKGEDSTYIQVCFRSQDCQSCQARHLCTRAKERRLRLMPKEAHQALLEARHYQASKKGRASSDKRAGVEGTISHATRKNGLRRTRYRGLSKTYFQHLATAAAINIDRLVAWFDSLPRGKTRVSRFALLAPH